MIYGDCREDEREDYQNCAVVHTLMCIHVWAVLTDYCFVFGIFFNYGQLLCITFVSFEYFFWFSWVVIAGAVDCLEDSSLSMTLSATRSHTHTSLYYDVVSFVCLSVCLCLHYIRCNLTLITLILLTTGNCILCSYWYVLWLLNLGFPGWNWIYQNLFCIWSSLRICKPAHSEPFPERGNRDGCSMAGLTLTLCCILDNMLSLLTKHSTLVKHTSQFCRSVLRTVYKKIQIKPTNLSNGIL